MAFSKAFRLAFRATFRIAFIVAFKDYDTSSSIVCAHDGFRIRVKSSGWDEGVRSIAVREFYGTMTRQGRAPNRLRHSEF